MFSIYTYIILNSLLYLLLFHNKLYNNKTIKNKEEAIISLIIGILLTLPIMVSGIVLKYFFPSKYIDFFKKEQDENDR